MSRSQCYRCGRTFSGLTSFDRHWSRVPMKAGELCGHPLHVGLVKNAKGVWGFPAPDEPVTYAGRQVETPTEGTD